MHKLPIFAALLLTLVAGCGLLDLEPGPFGSSGRRQSAWQRDQEFANLDQGSQMPRTGVIVNGRELHPLEVAQLQALLGPIAPGRYFVDAEGNAGREGGPVLVNLYQAAQGGNGSWSHASRFGGGDLHVGGDGNGFNYYIDSSGTSWTGN